MTALEKRYRCCSESYRFAFIMDAENATYKECNMTSSVILFLTGPGNYEVLGYTGEKNMPQNEQVSRYEVNRNVRMVFTRHDADLTRIDYSFMGSTVYLDGDIVKTDGDFSLQEIETIAREISALPHVRDVQFNLNNLTVVPYGDSWQVTRTLKSVAATGTADYSIDSTVVIEKAEELKDVLEDIQADSKNEE